MLKMIALTGSCLLVAACSASDSNTALTGPIATSVVPMCKAGCQETDPNPSAPGVFLGSAVTDETCFGTTQTDTDQDGLSDFCEYNLAAAFAPELWYASNDDIGREPHWAAAPASGGEVFRIAYLISYYLDNGTTSGVCNNPYGNVKCRGHYGDSEWIALDVGYDSGTHHWVLRTAYYSAHESVLTYAQGTGQYPGGLTYPSHQGSYPRSWVSFGKHANYGSQAECDSGGALDMDDCSLANSTVRVSAGGDLNLGSRSVHTSAQDCMVSSNPILAQYGYIECYWTTRNFAGWSGSFPDTDPYSPKLSDLGF